jgi:cytidine deaminase
VDDATLIAEARRAAEAAYAPYSGLSVGAAVLASDGRVFHGANVENASYGLTLCAERSALARAVAEGVQPGDVLAVAATAPPCGACRQWLAEFRAERVVYDAGGEVHVRTPAELLPDTFELDTQ